MKKEINGWKIVYDRTADGIRSIKLLSRTAAWLLHIEIQSLGRRTSRRNVGVAHVLLSLTDLGDALIGSEFMNSSKAIDWLPDSIPYSSKISTLLSKITTAANHEIFEINRRIFSEDTEFSEASTESLNNILKTGAKKPKAHVINYLQNFSDELESKTESGNPQERRAAISDLIVFLNKNPLYRQVLSENMSVFADDLEGRGYIIYNPKKISKNKNSGLSKITLDCQRLWEKYCKSPTKKNLKDVFSHLEAMKSSKSEKVKKERARCLRVANKEAKRLKLVK